MSRSSRDAPKRVSLLVRNIPIDARPEDVRAKFERFGEIRDIYMPKDYYTNRPRGFGFIEYKDSRDAEDALYHLDRSTFMGRELSVVMSKESRKTPRDMIQRERTYGGGGGGGGGYRGGGGYGGRDRYRDRSPRRHSRSRSRSPRGRRERSYSRSRSPAYRRSSRSRSRTPPPRRDSPPRDSPADERRRSPEEPARDDDYDRRGANDYDRREPAADDY